MITREEEVSWAYLLDPCFQFENTAGKPLTGGYIEVYLHGTRDRYYCASDFNGTLHPFQIKLDSIGSNIVLADPSNSYDVYVYNRYGNLVMSRYNVSTGHTGSGAYDRYDELENLIVSAVTALQGEIDDIDEALEGKKDKQEVISLTFTNTQTVSSIVQNENGELEITYQEIALPEQVPNIDIVSLASTISVSSVYDPETNIKTFNIDISDIGALEYGRYTAEPFNDYATLVKNKGNIDLEDGMLKLRKGNSYHVTVRGEYVSTDLDNTVQAIEYVEQVSNTRIKVDVDNTVADAQHFELSYDIFKLGHDTDYQVGFNQDTGIIQNLVLEIHSLSNVSVVNGGGGEQVQADWTEEDPEEPSYIQHKPEIKDLVEGTNIRFREEEDAIYIDAIVTAIPTVTGFATHEEVYESSVTAVQLATAQIPDSEEVQFEEINLDDYALASAIPSVTGFATHSEVYNSEVTAIQLVTGLIPDIDEGDIYNATVTAVQTATAQIPESEEVQFEEINLGDYALASAIPSVTGLADHSEVYNATVTAIEFVTAIIPEAQVQSDWIEEDTTDPAYILNKPTEKFLLEGDNIRIRETNDGVYIDALVTAIPSVTGFATDDDVYNATVTAVQLATSLIPEEQVQSDWAVTAIDSPAYIKNKPEILETLPIKGGDNIGIELDNDEVVISVTGEMGKTYIAGDYIHIDSNDVISVTGVAAATAIPDTEEVQFEEIDLSDYALASAIPEQVQSDWAATGINDPDYIKNKPNITPLIEGDNIHFSETVDGIMISASMPPVSGTVTEVEVYNATVTAVQLATGQIPDITNLASKAEVYNSVVTGVQLATAQIPDVSEFVTEDQVTALLPDTEDVQFEEIDLSDYALASAIPDVTNLASKLEVYNSVVTGVQLATAQIPDVTGFATKAQVYNATVTAIDTVTSIIPEAQVQSDWAVTAVDSPAYIKNKPEILENMPLKAGEGIGISVDDGDVVVAVTAQYLTEIPSTYATDTEVYNATVTGVQLATAQIPDSEDITFEEIDLSDYALASAIPDVSSLTTKSEVYNATVTAINAVTGNIGGDNVFIAKYGVTSYNDINAAYNAGKSIFVNYVDGMGEIYLIPMLYIDINSVAYFNAQVNSTTYVDIQCNRYSPTPWYMSIRNYNPLQFQANWNESNSSSKAYILNKPDLSDYALASAIPDVSSLTTQTDVYNATVTGVQAATGWTDAQNYLTSVPNTYATKTYVDNSVTGLQTKLRDINDIQVVASLPASPTSSTLYLIPEGV